MADTMMKVQFVIFHVFLTLAVISGDLTYSRNKFGLFKSQQKAVSGVFKRLPATSPQECGIYCTMEASCVGYSFRVRNIDSNISQPCELNNDRSTTFTPDEEFDYYSTCFSDFRVCKEKGTCSTYFDSTGAPKGYHCYCDSLAPSSACQFNCVFEAYPNHDITGNDIYDVKNLDIQTCLIECMEKNPTCLSVAHVGRYRQCYYKRESKDTKPSDFRELQTDTLVLYSAKCWGP